MDGVVHGNEVYSRRVVGRVGVPTEEQHGGVVVPVQEQQWLLAQDYEHGVDELEELAEVHEHDPSSSGTVGPGLTGRQANRALNGLR